MKKGHESFLKACLGESGFSSLSKAIKRQGLDGPSNLQDTYYALMVVPRSLLSWVSSTVKGMADGSNLEVEIPGGKSATLHIDKFKNDIYSGYIFRGGETIHRFADVTIPALASHLMTVLELYDDFHDSIPDSPTVINNLVPLIDQMVSERMKSMPQPVINITINNENESKSDLPPPPVLPVMKEEPSAVEKTDSYSAGYHMTLGNYFRNKGDKGMAKSHDEALQKYVKGKYSGLNKEEFAAGIKKAADCIKEEKFDKDEDTKELIEEHKRLVQVLRSPSHKDDKVEAKRQEAELRKLLAGKGYKPEPVDKHGDEDEENEEKEQHTDQYTDEREELRDEKEREEESEKEAMGKISLSPSMPAMAPPSMPKIPMVKPKMMPMTSPTKPSHDSSSKPSAPSAPKASGAPDYTKSEKGWEMSKSAMEARCPDCGGREFEGEEFVGCICMEPMRTSKIKIVKNENGNYNLAFGKGWDEENIELLLEILKKRNRHE